MGVAIRQTRAAHPSPLYRTFRAFTRRRATTFSSSAWVTSPSGRLPNKRWNALLGSSSEGMALPDAADLSLLDEDELALVKLAAQFPRIVEGAAVAHEPHRIAFYLGDLAGAFVDGRGRGFRGADAREEDG